MFVCVLLHGIKSDKSIFCRSAKGCGFCAGGGRILPFITDKPSAAMVWEEVFFFKIEDVSIFRAVLLYFAYLYYACRQLLHYYTRLTTSFPGQPG